MLGVKMLLSFFQNNKHDWPAISRLYRRKAPIRAAKVGVKRLFSCSKLVSNSKRYNMTGQSLKIIVMQNLWAKQQKKAFSAMQVVEENEVKKVSQFDIERS